MTEFEQVGKLILPVTPPPTQAELRAAYDLQHAVCPQCGGEPGETTCIGYLFSPDWETQDRNKTSCPGCGWKGIVHELAPNKEQT